MRELTQSTTSIALWHHRGIWANWANLLVDGLHFTDEGLRRYFNSVRGAIVAAMNRLVGSVSLISCNYRNRRRFWWYRDHLSQSSSTLPAGPQFENDMVVAACSVRHSGAACVAAARRMPGACRGFGFPEPRACRLLGACRAGLSIGCGWFMGTPSALRPCALRRRQLAVLLVVITERGSGCRTDLLSIVVCG